MNELERFFEPYMNSSMVIKLNQCSTILNLGNFLKSHFEVLRNNKGNRLFMPYYERLQQVKLILIEQKNAVENN